MKSGFRICIHKDCNKDDIEKMQSFIDKQIKVMQKGYGCRGGRASFYRRNLLGIHVNKAYDLKNLSNNYFFRRISTKRRIFAILPIDILEGDIKLDQCYCPTCLGGTRIKIKNGFNENDYNTIFEIGEIKG